MVGHPDLAHTQNPQADGAGRSQGDRPSRFKIDALNIHDAPSIRINRSSTQRGDERNPAAEG